MDDKNILSIMLEKKVTFTPATEEERERERKKKVQILLSYFAPTQKVKERLVDQGWWRCLEEWAESFSLEDLKAELRHQDIVEDQLAEIKKGQKKDN